MTQQTTPTTLEQAAEHYRNSVTRLEQERTAIFESMWNLLDGIVVNSDDTLWADEFSTAHEALIDIVAQYDTALADRMNQRLEAAQ